MRTIFHITTADSWEEARARGRYRAESLATEGFIHLSRPHQVLGVAARHFAGQSDLVLLQVNEEKVVADVLYEGVAGDEYPHIYGPLNLDAVVCADFVAGSFHLPPQFKLVGDTLVRPGLLGDEAEIASVHTHSWQQSYQGMVPDRILAERPLSFRDRMNRWRVVAAGEDPSTVFVGESAQHGVVAFCAVGPARDEEFAGEGEITAIYCLQDYKGRGIGAELLRMGQAHLKSEGHESSYLWALQDNPSCEFYLRMGAKKLEQRRNLEFGDKSLVQVVYRW